MNGNVALNGKFDYSRNTLKFNKGKHFSSNNTRKPKSHNTSTEPLKWVEHIQASYISMLAV